MEKEELPAGLDDLETPCAVVDLDVMEANLARVARYAADHGIALRPHTKTHKSPRIAAEQLRLGAKGVTVATPREAEVMAEVTADILVAYPPVGAARLRRLRDLPGDVRLAVALDSSEAQEALSRIARQRKVPVGVLVEVDAGMGRCGVGDPHHTVLLARAGAESPGTEFRGILFYPGHVRSHVEEQDPHLEAVQRILDRHLEALEAAGLRPEVVSGGSTPTLFRSHELRGVNEIRPGTYVFNDRTTLEIGACGAEDCAFTVLATVVSTAVSGQAVIDAGSKSLSREEIRAPGSAGFGALLDRPEVIVKATSEEHGLLDLSATGWRPKIGDRVRVVPNHVCVSVNLQERVHGVRDGRVETAWPVAARGREPAS